MAATIKIKNSSTASAVPTSSDLVQGELAVNVTDKRIFTENASGTVVELGTNPSILTLPDGSASAPTLTNDGDTNTGLFFPAADTVGITTGGTERARVDSSGSWLVGTTTKISSYDKVGVLFDGAASYGIVLKTSYAGINSLFATFYSSDNSQIGSISQNAASTVAYSTSSDYRLKNTIAPMTGALAKVAALKPVTYKWNSDGSEGEGFIAHELAEVCPHAVIGEKDAVDEKGNPKYQGIDTSFLVATLTAAIQELKAELDSNKREFDAYKALHP